MSRVVTATLLAVVSLAALAMVLHGCASPEEELDNAFEAFLESRSSEGYLVLPSGLEVGLGYPDLELWKEDADYSADVSLFWYLDCEPEAALDAAAMGLDFRYLGDLVVEFADQEGWHNSYNLYMRVLYGGDALFSYLYNYETGRLYRPEGYGTMRRMSDQFGTLDFDDVASTEEGRVFLQREGLCETKHGKIERTMKWPAMGFPDAPFDLHQDGEVYFPTPLRF